MIVSPPLFKIPLVHLDEKENIFKSLRHVRLNYLWGVHKEDDPGK